MLAKSIAIIDDEADLVYLFKEVLEINGFKVSYFTDPIEALNKLQQNLQDYMLIISDYKMPSMNGNELCTKLLSLNPELKIILISAYDNIQYDESKFTLIRKPIVLSQMVKIVKENLPE